MMLRVNDFGTMLKGMPPSPDADTVLAEVIAKTTKERRDEAEKAFYLLMRIMKAKSTAELSDVEIKDVIACFEWQSVFEEIFMAQKAGNYFDIVKWNIKAIPTARRVRVL